METLIGSKRIYVFIWISFIIKIPFLLLHQFQIRKKRNALQLFWIDMETPYHCVLADERVPIWSIYGIKKKLFERYTLNIYVCSFTFFSLIVLRLVSTLLGYYVHLFIIIIFHDINDGIGSGRKSLCKNSRPEKFKTIRWFSWIRNCAFWSIRQGSTSTLSFIRCEL